MDKRISLINRAKKRLNNLLTRKEENITKIKNDQNISSIRALLLRENIQLGLAITDTSFMRSEIYSEFSEKDGYRFHVYPLITPVKTNQDDKEVILVPVT
jgi:hypothetical protein